MKKYKILIVEDDLTLGELLLRVFSRRENVSVTWYVRARRDGAGALIFMDADGAEFSFCEQAFDLAFVDWQLKMSSLSGLEVTRELCARAMVVVAASGDPSLNSQLVEAGARIGITKDRLFSRALEEADFVEQLAATLP